MVTELTEVEFTESIGPEREKRVSKGYYLGIAYHGSFDTGNHTRIMVIRKDNGQTVEVYPTKVRFLK